MTEVVFRAVEIMIREHAKAMPEEKRFRKYSNNVPFSVHPTKVARKVSNYLRSCDSGKRYIDHEEEMIVVALLHDVPEDTFFTLDDVEREFGKKIRDGIWWLTNPSKERKDLNRAARKQMDREHLAKAPPQIQVIKMIDRTDNLLDMQLAPHDFILKVYIPESHELAKVLRPADEYLAELLVGACNWLQALTNGSK